MRLFVVSVVFVALSRQKVGNGIGREPKGGSNLQQVGTLKKENFSR
jgi:hypothetical protein